MHALPLYLEQLRTKVAAGLRLTWTRLPARLTCGDRWRKAASRLRKQEEARRQEEAARRARLECWQVFLPATRRCLERLEALAGARLAEELAEAIRSECAGVSIPPSPR